MDQYPKFGPVVRLLCISLVLLLCLNPVKAQDQIVVNIRIDGIESATGKLVIGVYNGPEHFLDEEILYKQEFRDVKSTGTMQTTVTLPEGEFAFSMYHDVNGNGKMDRNMFKYPKEPFAFSGTPHFRFGPPKFEDVKVRIDQAHHDLEFQLD